jgi:hypothetical protein
MHVSRIRLARSSMSIYSHLAKNDFSRKACLSNVEGTQSRQVSPSPPPSPSRLGEGVFDPRLFRSYPRPLAGEGRVRVPRAKIRRSSHDNFLPSWPPYYYSLRFARVAPIFGGSPRRHRGRRVKVFWLRCTLNSANFVSLRWNLSFLDCGFAALGASW